MNNKSFTLIEILTVILIVGVLSGIIIVATNNVIDSTQDAKRKKDLDAISKSLMEYNTQVGVYPVEVSECDIGDGTCLDELIDSGYTTTFPLDPDGTRYKYTSDGITYTIKATMSDEQILIYVPGEGFSFESFSDPIVNGSFDGTWTGWSTAGGASTRVVNDTSSYSGTYTSYLNYNLTCVKEEIYQNITIPNASGTVNLEFWERTYLTAWAGSTGVKFDDTWLFRVDYNTSGRRSTTTNWAKQTIDVSSYKGQTVKLAMVWEDYYYCSNGDHDGWIRVDEIKLVQP